MNHTCLFLSSRSWSSFTDPGGMEGWVGLLIVVVAIRQLWALRATFSLTSTILIYCLIEDEVLTFDNELYRDWRTSFSELRVRRTGVAARVVWRHRPEHERTSLGDFQSPRPRPVAGQRRGFQRSAVLRPAHVGDRRVGVGRAVEARRHSASEEPASRLTEHPRQICNNDNEQLVADDPDGKQQQ